MWEICEWGVMSRPVLMISIFLMAILFSGCSALNGNSGPEGNSIAEIERNGVLTKARVLESAPSWNYTMNEHPLYCFVAYEFKTSKGDVYHDSDLIPIALLYIKSFKPGSIIDIKYLEKDPAQSMVAWK